MKFSVETEQETDGRWIAEIAEIPGAMKYGNPREYAIAQAERIEHGEHIVEPIEITFTAA